MADMHMAFSAAALVKVADVIKQEEIFGGHVQAELPNCFNVSCIYSTSYSSWNIELNIAVSHMTFFDAIGAAGKDHPLQVMC